MKLHHLRHPAKQVKYGENAFMDYGFMAAIDPDFSNRILIGRFIGEFNLLNRSDRKNLQEVAEFPEWAGRN
jgi:hypothetical protein